MAPCPSLRDGIHKRPGFFFVLFKKTKKSKTPRDDTLDMSLSVSTSGRVYEDFTRLLFFHARREASTLVGELPEESDQFRFLRVSHLDNLKGSVGLILAKTSAIWVTIPIDLSTRSFIFSVNLWS